MKFEIEDKHEKRPVVAKLSKIGGALMLSINDSAILKLNPDGTLVRLLLSNDDTHNGLQEGDDGRIKDVSMDGW